jgi:tripartite-type tricarboxylate transporter receptor subunit TctC
MRQGAVSVRSFVCTLAALGCALSMGYAQAQQKYPSKNILLLSALTAGAPDALQRSIADSINTRTGANVVVEPRPGAGGAVAAAAVANAEPDGHTIGLTFSGPLIATPMVNKDIKYDPLKSFAPIALVARGGAIIVSNTKVPANNFVELLKLAKSRPDQPLRIGYASLANRLALLSFADVAKVKFLDVPFNTGTSMHTAAIAGDLDLLIEAPGSVYGLIKDGRLKAIATGDKTREPLYPQVGTISEVLPGQLMTFWFGMVAPAATPKDRLAWLEREVLASLEDPRIKARMFTAGINVLAGSSKALTDEIKSTREQFAKVVKQYNITQN